MMDTPIRLGVLGCGWIASNRLRQIASGGLADVVLVADPDPRAARLARQIAPAARIVESLSGSDLAGLDGMMISTPSALHADQARELLESGVPVFVQKPLALNRADVESLLQRAAAADLPLATDLCYRHLRSAVALREALHDATAGAPFLVEGCFHNAYRPGAGWSHDRRLAGGGALMDLGTHLLDLVMWLTDEPLILDRACLLREGRPARSDDVEDFAAVDLHLAGGGQVRLATSWDASTGQDAEIRLRLYRRSDCLELTNHRGSFFHFDAWRYRGTDTVRLAADRDDAWQAGPLRDWLRRLQEGWGYDAPKWAAQPVELIGQAYAMAQEAQPEIDTDVRAYPCSREGVLP